LRFPGVDFRHQSFDRLPDGNFDVITVLSTLHYIQDREVLLLNLIARLSENGVLILEISMAPDGENEWISTKRLTDEGMFPTPQRLSAMLKDCAWKIIGHGVTQAEDPFPRYIVHVRKLKPYAWLLMQNPGAGKSTIIRRVFRQNNTAVISGDELYKRLAQGEYRVSEKLRLALRESFSPQCIDTVTRLVFDQGLLKDVVAFWTEHVGYRDFALDSYVPEEYRHEVKQELQALGYFPVELNWDNPVSLQPLPEAQSSANEYRRCLARKNNPYDARYVNVAPVNAAKDLPFIRHLDFPIHNEWAEAQSDIRVSGWLINTRSSASLGEIYVSSDTEHFSYPIDKVRLDVLSHVFRGTESVPPEWRGKACGFNFALPYNMARSGFEIGLMESNRKIALWHVTLSPESKP